MLFSNHLVIIRGGGDLATGVAYRLHKAGFPLIITELAAPLVVRRTVSLANAVLEGQTTVEELHAQRVDDAAHAAAHAVAHAVAQARAIAAGSAAPIPVLVAPQIEPLLAHLQDPALPDPTPTLLALVDARMAKRNIDTSPDQAPLVIALGPGFTAGQDCHAVVETMRGHRLGRVIWQGAAQPNTGSPGTIAGKAAERVLRAPGSGVVSWKVNIGDLVRENQVLGDVDGNNIRAPFYGIVRGLIAPNSDVSANMKIGDIDPRADAGACHTISDKSLAIGGGVLEAILTHLNRQHDV